MTKALDHGTQFAWRTTPFGRIRKVPPFEAERWPCYSRRPQASAKRRDWTDDEVEQLYRLLDAGHGYTEIAPKLGRSRQALIVKTNRLRCKMTSRATVLTARDAGRLLGVGCAKIIVRWIGLGWLKAQAADAKGRVIWRVQYDDLVTFLQNPNHWMAWEPSRIIDEELRAEMQMLRASQPQWLSVGAVAHRYHVGQGAVNDWIARGLLPSRRYGNHWINERDLEHFIPPCERPRARRKAVAA